MIVGHTAIVKRLSQFLPRVAIFLGPASVGKWTTAEELRYIHQYPPSDILRVRTLNAVSARNVVDFAAGAPADFSRLVIVSLAGASKASLNILLKALEESPFSTRFILVCHEPPMQTILTRGTVFNFRLLEDAEVAEILVAKRGVKPAQAANFAKASQGQVARAIALLDGGSQRAEVVQAVKAVRDGDEKALEKLAAKWSADHTELIKTWAAEATTKRWRMFLDTDVPNPSANFPLIIMRALREDVRPRFVVRAQLMTALRENR